MHSQKFTSFYIRYYFDFVIRCGQFPLNMALNTTLPEDTTSLCAGITCCWVPLLTLNVTSESLSLLKRNVNLSRIVALLPCQLYVDDIGKLECPLYNNLCFWSCNICWITWWSTPNFNKILLLVNILIEYKMYSDFNCDQLHSF